MSEHLFVYGTLLPRYAPADVRHVITQLRPIALGSMPGRVYDMGDFPAAVFDRAAGSRVFGEVFELPDDANFLAKLDAYEEFDPGNVKGSLFLRQQRPVALLDGRELPCWVYTYNRDPGNAQLVPDGDYSAWISAQHDSRT